MGMPTVPPVLACARAELEESVRTPPGMMGGSDDEGGRPPLPPMPRVRRRSSWPPGAYRCIIYIQYLRLLEATGLLRYSWCMLIVQRG